MEDQPNNPEEPIWNAPNDIELAGSVNVPPPMMSGTLQIAYADRVLVEYSETLKRLHKPGVGDYLVYSRVLVEVSGQEPVEITTDASPEEVEEYGPNPGPDWYGPV